MNSMKKVISNLIGSIAIYRLQKKGFKMLRMVQKIETICIEEFNISYAKASIEDNKNDPRYDICLQAKCDNCKFDNLANKIFELIKNKAKQYDCITIIHIPITQGDLRLHVYEVKKNGVDKKL